jgi:hypothetical protein
MAGRAILSLLVVAAAARGAELFNEKVAMLDPFPREVARGKSLDLAGTCRGAYKVPELILIAPLGKTYKNEDFEIHDPAFKFHVRFEEGAGPYRLELIAHTADGTTRSAARFTIYYGVPKPEKEPEDPPLMGPKTQPALDERVLEKRFLRILNDFRASIGCDAVGWNEAVAARAREHARWMAKANRRQYRFGKGGSIPEMLEANGAGTSGLSGPATPWHSVDSLRPFPPQSPGVAGPKVVNRLVVQLVSGDSLEDAFERYFVREAAFRICAADPHCLEVAIGAARAAAPPPPKGKPAVIATNVFYTICFLQVNEKPLIRAQDEAFDALLKRGREREPDVLRALGCWGRPRAWKLLEGALDDERPEVAGAAFDGLLVLDEEKARAEYARRTQPKENALAQRRYADAAALFGPFREVTYDRQIRFAFPTAVQEAQAAARAELATIIDGPKEDRDRLVADLRKRVKGLEMDDQIDKALALR